MSVDISFVVDRPGSLKIRILLVLNLAALKSFIIKNPINFMVLDVSEVDINKSYEHFNIYYLGMLVTKYP